MNWNISIFLLLTFLWQAKSGPTTDNDGIAFPRAELEHEDEEIVTAINSFGFRLLTEAMKQHENENVILSPTSIAGVLAMTLLGTVGQASYEIADTLGFARDILRNRLNHELFGDLLKSLNSNDTSSKTLFADGIFVDDHSQLRDAYRNYLHKIYDGEAHTIDFTDRCKSKRTINEWVKNHTEGKIENFLEAPLSPDTRVVLLSALYFSGQWARPFLEEHTRTLPFHNPVREVMADLMLNAGSFNYILSTTHGVQMVALPYNDSTVMYILMPLRPKESSLPELLNTLDYFKIDSLIKQMRHQECVIRLPKMDLKNSVDLRNCLQSLGVNSIFIPQQANFALMIDGNGITNNTEDDLISRINDHEEVKGLQELLNNLPNPGVYVDVIKHDVKLRVNEYGTEAVAVTAAFLARSAALFYADSPFYMFIRNEKTKLVTFSGVIFDPTAT